MARGVLRLIVPSPDHRRVLARPNGLAGWALPALAVDLPFASWDDESVARAGRLLGVPVGPREPVGTDCWVVEPTGRVPAVGRTWVGLDEVDRLGADAGAVRAWAAGLGSGG